MSYYFVANIRINDPEQYQRYIDGAGSVFNKYKGTYLAVDNDPELLEGQWSYNRSVIIKFPSRNDFFQWYHSSEYQHIVQYRLNAADCDTILVKGVSEHQ